MTVATYIPDEPTTSSPDLDSKYRGFGQVLFNGIAAEVDSGARNLTDHLTNQALAEWPRV